MSAAVSLPPLDLTSKPSIGPAALQRAEGDLQWRYVCAAGAVGFRAQPYDFDKPRGGGEATGIQYTAHGEKVLVVDSAFIRRFDASSQAEKAQRIDLRLALVSAQARAVFREAYEPHGWSGHEKSRAEMTLPGARASVCVLGMIDRSRILAHEQRSKKKEHETRLTFLDFLAGSTGHVALLRKVRTELRELLDAELAQYVEIASEVTS